jgi:hypothetical protein
MYHSPRHATHCHPRRERLREDDVGAGAFGETGDSACGAGCAALGGELDGGAGGCAAGAGEGGGFGGEVDCGWELFAVAGGDLAAGGYVCVAGLSDRGGDVAGAVAERAESIYGRGFVGGKQGKLVDDVLLGGFDPALVAGVVEEDAAGLSAGAEVERLRACAEGEALFSKANGRVVDGVLK